MATELSWHIGTEEDPDYDREVQMDPALCALAEGMESLISEFGPLGRPLWPPVTSSLVAAFQSGEAKRNMAVLSTDSSPAGWAALLKWWWGGRDQRAAELCAASRVDLVPLHVPGSKLVEEGIHRASRDGDYFGAGANAYSLHGPAVLVGLWELVLDT